MVEFYIRLADKLIFMRSRFRFAENFCRDYIADAAPADISAVVADAELEAEMRQSEVPVSRECAECLCLYRHIAERLPLFNRCVMHGAAITYGENAYIFTAPSGTGKTTHIRLWEKYLGEWVDIVNGDKPILHIEASAVTVFGTPWAGKEALQKNRSAPLKAICIIKQAKENKIAKVNPKEQLAVLLNQIYLPKDAVSAKKTLELFNILLNQIPIYVLECDMSEDAVQTSFKALTGQEYSQRGKKNED